MEHGASLTGRPYVCMTDLIRIGNGTGYTPTPEAVGDEFSPTPGEK